MHHSKPTDLQQPIGSLQTHLPKRKAVLLGKLLLEICGL
jgi:hypothetical protein